MKAAIEKSMSNVSGRSLNETCLEQSSDSSWHVKTREFQRKRYYLWCHNMCMGPARVFPEYFPPEFDFDKFERRQIRPKKKKASGCRTWCGGDRVPGAFDLGLQCEFTTHIPLDYAPKHLRSHERYCGCRDDLCPNKRSTASHEPCK